jgi:hypothetical protein
MQGGAVHFDCVFGARLLEISGSSFVANGDGGVVEAGDEVDASSGPQPVICVGAGCNNGNFTCAEYLSYVEIVSKTNIEQACLGLSLGWHAWKGDIAFFNLPEGVRPDDYGSFIVDVCPAECSEVVSRVSHGLQIKTTTQYSSMN